MVSVLATVGLLAFASANASLVGDQVDITFASPDDGISLLDTGVTVGAGNENEIQPGDGTVIGGNGTDGSTPLLSHEFLDIQADGIILQLESGANSNGNLITGYSPGAYWLIADLDFAGGSITGFDLFLTGISNFTAADDIIFSDNNTFKVFISKLFIADSNTDFDVGQIELRLRTDGTPPPPVPLPATLPLLSLGLGAVAGMRRRRPR